MHTATGNGHNKKEAKQAAAKLLLDKIKSNNGTTLTNNDSFLWWNKTRKLKSW